MRVRLFQMGRLGWARCAAVAALWVAAASAQGQAPIPAGAAAASPTSGASRSETPARIPLVKIQDLVRLEGQGESVLRGLGIVTGLRGTGDAGTELAVARPLARIHQANGNPLGDLAELGKARAAAVVLVECVLPRDGALADDTFDVTVTVMHSATSLRGGQLFLAPLSGPMPWQGVYAMAAGPISLEDPEIPTRGRVRMGARLIRDLPRAGLGPTITLIVEPPFRGWGTTQLLAQAINDVTRAGSWDGSFEAQAQTAIAVDDARVLVRVPEADLADPSLFITTVLSTGLSPTLLDLPATVIVNERTGSIVMTADVEISPVAIAHKDLVITTTTPAPAPTAEDPIVASTNWTDLQTAGRATENAKLSDLIAAFRTLSVPAADQIQILSQLHQTGRLHARFVVQ